MARVLLAAIASLLVQGCTYLFFPPDTFKDMWLRADALGLPEDFVLVYREQDGLRSTFAAAPTVRGARAKKTSELGTYLRPHDGACWVPPGGSLVRITIRGGRDWFIPAV